MKRFLITLLLFVSSNNIFSSDNILFRVSDYPPYYFQENGIWKGLSVELMNVLLKEAGYSITYKEIPWKRALNGMRTGNIDAMANLSITEERSEYIHFVGPQMDESMVLFVNNDFNYKIDSLEDIKNISGKIGIHLGLSYGDEFDTKLKNDPDFSDKFSVISDGNKFGMLSKKKRISGFVLNKYVFYYKQSISNEFDTIVEHPYVINQDFIYFGFSKNNFNEDQIKQLQKAYLKVKERGDFDRILDKYKSPSL